MNLLLQRKKKDDLEDERKVINFIIKYQKVFLYVIYIIFFGFLMSMILFGKYKNNIYKYNILYIYILYYFFLNKFNKKN